MDKNKALEKTADFIDGTALGKFVFYASLLSLPVLTGYTIGDIALTDIDTTVTAKSTSDTQIYLKQIKEMNSKYARAEKIDEVILNIQTPEALDDMQQHQVDLYKDVADNFKLFESQVLTDLDLTEKNYVSIASAYNSSSSSRIMPVMMARVLDECRISTASDINDISVQANDIKKCMNDERPHQLTWFLVFGVPLLSFLGLFANGISYDSKSISRKTADFLRGKEAPKRH